MEARVKTCKLCKRLFTPLNTVQKLCPACVEKMEKKYTEVRDYIWANKGVSINQVAEACDIPKSQIVEWVRQERLEFTDSTGSGVVCEVCGKPIITGRFCDECKGQALKDLDSVTTKKPLQQTEPAKRKKDKEHMRFINK